MEPELPDQPPARDCAALDELLEALGAHPEWTERQRDEQLERLVARVPQDELRAALADRLDDLGGPGGEALLRLVEGLATPELLQALAEALVAQPELAPERTWEALALLEGTELLDDYPELAARWQEIDETLDEEGSLGQLAEQLEDDPDGIWLALQGLGAIEADIRPQIIAGLVQVPLGPGLAEFLRLLSFAHDPATSAAALEVLGQPREASRELMAAWSSLAADHPDPAVLALARSQLASAPGTALVPRSQAPTSLLPLGPVRSLVSALDGQGRGTIVFSTRPEAEPVRVTAAFLCNMATGVHDVVGQVDGLSELDPAEREPALDALAGQGELDVVEGANELALRLLGGCVLLCGPSTPPVLRYWLEKAVHPAFRPLPFPTPFAGWDPASLPLAEMPARARAVLEACPTWYDDSALTYEMAEEIALRESMAADPDPKRDAGAYRYLFEHRLARRLELYCRMLYWMASFWQAAGNEYLGRSALALAGQLADPQHAVPGHPFTVALATRSLAIAQVNLRSGLDPRVRHAAPGA